MDASEKTRAWTLTDELVLEVYAMTRRPSSPGPEDLMTSLRGCAVRAAMKIVQGVHGSKGDLGACLRSALCSLAELRYYVYLARRLGVIDLRRYRTACGRHERAVRCVRALLVAEELGLNAAAAARGAGSFRAERAGAGGAPGAEAVFLEGDGPIALGPEETG